MEGSEDWFIRAMQMQTQTQTQMEMQASRHVQSKHEEREIRKRSGSIFTRWPTMIELLPVSFCDIQLIHFFSFEKDEYNNIELFRSSLNKLKTLPLMISIV